MSDLGAIFHVKKDGTQYDAHAYTTPAECSEPNLKIKFNDSPAYVKLDAKGSGDVPCYVKKSDGSVYQIKKEAEVVPTGSISMNGSGTFTVPSGVHVIKISHPDLGVAYVGVTPKKKHSLSLDWDVFSPAHYYTYITCVSHKVRYLENGIITEYDYQEPEIVFYVRWSPEINTHATDINDY